VSVPVTGLQFELERLYGVSAGYDVADFLISDPVLAGQLDTGQGARISDEKLLVRETEDGLEMSLYLANSVLNCLDGRNPLHTLDLANLQAFLLALEGVSHFLYVAWNAGQGKPITLFELELQAEVDKYAACALLMKRQGGAVPTEQLARTLFQNVSYDPALSDEALDRYRYANQYASQYCRHLAQRYAGDATHDMQSELRRFYRLPQADKVSRIHSGPI
jgi:hypothetical protein